jgi:hypothetical protein
VVALPMALGRPPRRDEHENAVDREIGCKQPGKSASQQSALQG